MKVSAKALHALRALVSMQTSWPEGSSWYHIRTGFIREDRTATDLFPAEYVKVMDAGTPPDGAVETFADIDIHDEIGAYGVDAKTFMADIKKLAVDRINLSLHSPGGEYRDGLAIYHALQEHPAKVHVKVMGLAASAASFIATAGDHVTMHKRAEMMIHDASGCGMGNKQEIGKTVNALSRADANIAGIYADASAKRLGVPYTEEQFAALMTAETWFTPQEAKDHGLIDEIIELPEDDDETDSDAKVAVSNMDRLAVNALVALAAEAGYEIDVENKRLTLADLTDRFTPDNGKPDDLSAEEPATVKASDNGEDPATQKAKLRLAIAKAELSL